MNMPQGPDIPLSENWDVIDPNRLLLLVNFRKTNTELGYLLRHYWIPATELTYRVTTEQRQKDRSVTAEKTVTHMMGRCNADDCGWREQIAQTDDNWPHLIQMSRWWTKNEICSYNRSEQTFRRHPLLDFEQWPKEEKDARNQAFLCQAVMPPLLPACVGFQWHIRNEEGYLNYTLESTATYGEMIVLTIRRRGEFLLRHYYKHKTEYPLEFRVRREGVTAYALNRSVVLEDRTHDVVFDAADQPELDGLETWTVHHLTKSAALMPPPKS